jgi:hypothetical protein
MIPTCVHAKYSYIISAAFSHFNVLNNCCRTCHKLKCNLSLRIITNRRNIKILFLPARLFCQRVYPLAIETIENACINLVPRLLPLGEERPWWTLVT